ncbi:MAG: hypothetical protein AB7O43_19395 [Hyphomicrobiaceae bacterium]
MTTLLWQSALMLLGAYFLGAFLGCLVRRTMFAGTLATAQATVSPQPATATVPAVPANRDAARFERALSGAGTGSVETRPRPPVKPPLTPSTDASLPAAMGTSEQAAVAAPVAPMPAPADTASAAPADDDLTLIRAIDPDLKRLLNRLGVSTFAGIASWKPDDVTRIASALGVPGRIEQENWIEQAQILANGGETYYSRRKSKGETPSARPTPDEGEQITVPVPAATEPPPSPPEASPEPASPEPALPVVQESPQSSPSDIAAAAAAAAAAAVASESTPLEQSAPSPAPVTSPSPAVASPPVGMVRDKLQRIAGINAEVERLLNLQGITGYRQISEWGQTDVARIDRLLGFEGRISRENWIEQAKVLASGGQTAYSRAMDRRAQEGGQPEAAASSDVSPAASARPDLSGLRSVRSEAYRDDEAGPLPGIGAAPRADDLKRIRGVGVLIEKKLNSLGVTRYEQVANWTVADIERFSEKLDFRGRIERENWVEQARILAAGGHTEFSQRVDRGEVETSRRG